MALRQVEPRGLDEQIALANRVQSSKVNSLMKSIDKLQKENRSLQKKSLESNRTCQYKKIQDELGQQDVMIDVLQCCIGTEKAQKLMTNAIQALDLKRTGCSSCSCEEELFSGEGSWLCRRCYSQRFWREPPADAEKCSVSKTPKFPDSKDKLQKECAALEAELTSTRRYLKQQSPLSALPKSASLNTVAALSNLLAGYVQRADQLEKENASLKNHQEQLEGTVKEQEEHHRQQIQYQLAVVPIEQGTSTVEDLQSRIRLRNGETDRMAQFLEELRSQIASQKGKQEVLKAEIDSAQNEVRKLQQEMSTWASAETAEHAKQLAKLQESKEQRKQHLLNSREQLQDVKTKLRKSLQSIGDQRGPLEVQARIKGQAKRLNLALRDALSRPHGWSKFSSQLEIEKGGGLAEPVQQVLDRYEVEIQSKERPTPKRLEELKQDLYSLEVNGASKGIHEVSGRWSVAKKMQEDFRSKLNPQLEALSKLETLLDSKQQALEHLVAEVRKNNGQVSVQRSADIRAALDTCALSLLTTTELHEQQRKHSDDLKQMKSVTGPLEESVEALRSKVKDLAKNAADSDQYRQVSQMSLEVQKLRKSVELERRTARNDVVKLHAAAERCQEMMANREGEDVAPGPSDLPVPARLPIVPPGSSAEEARGTAAIEARLQRVWEKRFLPVEERDLPAIHLPHLGDTGELPDDWQESMKLQAQLDLLREELSRMQDTKSDLTGKIEAPDEVRDMEDYVDNLDAVHTDLQEVVADLNMRLQAARVLLQRQMQRRESRGAPTCQHCPHCLVSQHGAAK